MKRRQRASACAAAALLGAGLGLTPAAPALAQTLPTDVSATCIVAPTTFAQWFAGGQVTANGVVQPASGLAFPSPAESCNFYTWAHQMMLWLLSPVGGSYVFNSPLFYEVQGKQMVQLGQPGAVRRFNLRAGQVGPLGLPVIKRDGRIISLLDNAQVINTAGRRVPLGGASTGAQGQAQLLDRTGKTIRTRLPLLVTAANGRTIRMVRQTVEQGHVLLFDAAGNAYETDQGQAGGNGVLMSQNGSLVYYTTEVNDVYAYFRTGTKNGAFKADKFPTSQPTLAPIVQYAKSAKIPSTLPDQDALTIELKMSWVEATGLDTSQYVTIRAQVPVYDTSSNKVWKPVPKQSRTVTLALVGIHIVGSVNNHPEMNWATFEHVGNTPLAAYSYTNTSNATVTVPQSTAGSWIFSATNASGSFNVQHMHYDSKTGAILADKDQTIGASNTLRINPWGSTADAANAVANNTDVLSINNSVIGQLANGDLRKNYVMTGATWGTPGVPPPKEELGTVTLANSTMETYHLDLNCFNCHQGDTTGVSHIYGGLNPLFK